MKSVQIPSVLHVSASLSRNAGGIFEIALAVARHHERMGLQVSAVGLHDNSWDLDKDRWNPVNAQVFPTLGPKSFGYSPGLHSSLLSSDADILHLHSMWMHPSVAVSSWHRATGRPYVVTPNGMLEPWALSNSGWKKKIARSLYEMKMLHHAGCIHANTRKELSDVRAFGLHNPVALIPNGVDLPDQHSPRTIDQRPILLFLGRLHPKKGIENALKAWGALLAEPKIHSMAKPWTFVIAGWDQGGHEAELRRICMDSGLEFRDIPADSFNADELPEVPVVFAGPAFGEHKARLFEAASAFILPSFSEGLPMSVLEAWSYGLPVLMTDHCNLPEGFTSGAAMRIEPNMDSIHAALRQLVLMPTELRSEAGTRGHRLAKENFSWSSVAERLSQVYQWLTGKDSKPDFVVTDD